MYNLKSSSKEVGSQKESFSEHSHMSPKAWSNTDESQRRKSSVAEDKKLGVQVSETLAVEPAKLAIVDLSYNPSQSTSKITNKVLSLQITTCSESYTR